MDEDNKTVAIPTYEQRIESIRRNHYLRVSLTKSWLPLFQVFMILVGVVFFGAIMARLIILMYTGN